jgi:TonB family protein
MGAKMSRDWRQWEGQVVNGSFPLRQYLGGSDHSAVFLTERRGRDPLKAAIKLIAVDPANTAVQLARWESAAKLAHPHLLRLFESGSCQLDNVVLLYLVMEYAEDNLAQILPHRALTAEEARDLLEPALDTLAFIHGKSLAHGRLKPSNILAAGDQLKLSSDSLVRFDDPATGAASGRTAYPSVYDAPEIASGKISPASDSWSLGMTLMEALTQRLPAREAVAEPVLETVPAPFMGIAHCCLRRDPQRRCGAADIAARLRSSLPSSMSKVIARAQGPSTLRIPAAAAKWRYILPVAAVVLVAAAVLLGPKLMNQRSESTQPAAVSAEQSGVPAERSAEISSAQPTGAAELERTPPTEAAAKPSARKHGNANLNSAASSHAAQPTSSKPASPKPAAPEPATMAAVPAAAEAPAANAAQGEVVQQIMPAVSKSARDTIHGTIKVRVRVGVDSAGNVETASLVSPGPSKYFARQAMEAAQQWKFVPGQDARAWIVRFGFRRSGTDAVLEAAKP